LKNVTIPSSVTTIEDYVFMSNPHLESIMVEEGNTEYQSVAGVLFSIDGTTIILFPEGKNTTVYTIPENVTITRGFFLRKQFE